MSFRTLFGLLILIAGAGITRAQSPASDSLALAAVFTDHMVLQRNKPVHIYGRARAGEKVRVGFQGMSRETAADTEGKWKVVFPAQKAGGPYALTVSGAHREVVLNDILVGDVWLCSGQSNMDFQLKNAATGPEELKKGKFNPHIRLLKFRGSVPWGDIAWDSATLARVNRYDFFKGEWKTPDVNSAAAFSAVAYYFGQQIAASENVPIGLIQVAVGGSPTESWIDEKVLARDSRFAGMLSDWQHSGQIMEWCRERAGVNTRQAQSADQRHPFKPGYNYQAGIAPLTDFPVAGIIWYQGESNVHNVTLHEALFEMLVKSWRQSLGNALPFYYVQLSGIERPNWPEFRDSQRQMLDKISHSGMAVSYDLGDSLDVHPVRKKEIGERLALLALRGHYGKPVIANGPVISKATLGIDGVFLDFTSAQKLRTPNNEPLMGFELLTKSGKRMPAQAVLSNNRVRILLPAGEAVQTVLYAYRPFTRANLYNEAGLPAATFSISVH
ncbi:sialate O-acetylesterase [Dyadobacter sp. BE34]|uniref:Sialate O-acetylesterase n=1 Tax=Dyadobacter fermentans TaxID=94254 RepID=A0ABU1QV17_9BACT|nr:MULTISPECIES: sialate O-acetylesterase [Dyadobacter]MDR6804989.1 sialate O-acetylesterase [Dyadobacter fermentans]MDR7043252.1 sialate O-acetylesterase [Dyadobacter sp. BE242]MDR7197564.1 sialate O-acetylesterase [Dyadobacter sp. BE34]MDR7215003.1 sialate O-acetylesterase [Dyadobacter sp. BE31]MDR7262538.1 sialate O-acetylesterase [Dyadobacter sp. BE32]